MPANAFYDSLFAKNHVDLNRPRSSFPRPHKVYTSLDAGVLVPLAIEEVLPGDTVTRSTKQLWRLATPKFPTMDHAFLDVYNFFIPYRILHTNFKRIFGESETPWINSDDYSVPQIKFDAMSSSIVRGVAPYSVGDYLGLPTAMQINNISNTVKEDYSVSSYPGRGYAMTWNEYFRDVNLMPAAYCPLDDSDRMYIDVDPEDPYASAFCYGALLPVSKVHDYFTSALPHPQRGDSVSISAGAVAPVIAGSTMPFDEVYQGVSLRFYSENSRDIQNRFVFPNVVTPNGTYANLGRKVDITADGNHSVYKMSGTPITAGASPTSSTIYDSALGNVSGVVPANLYADLSSASATSINTLRMAVATQQYLELLARGGNRYRSFIYSFFGVTSPDASLQIPQYLSGRRIPIKISQVIQTSSDDTVSNQPLGETGAYSLTYDDDFDFKSSFTEYGMILTVGCLRTTHTYTQGMHKLWKRQTALDFYTPIFANVGEMPIDKSEIVFSASSEDHNVFGYAEAWAEYRFAPNTGTARFRAGHDAAESFLPWTYIDDYRFVPSLSEGWIAETPGLLNRSLVVQTNGDASQLFGEIHFEDVWRRVMPIYSIPGLYKL